MDSPTSDKMSEETVSDNKKSSHRRTTSSVTTNEVASMKMIQNEPEEVAIKLDKAYKSYGSRKHKHPVLMGLDMEVGKGHIYGLLGKSMFILSLIKYVSAMSHECLSTVSVMYLYCLSRILQVVQKWLKSSSEVSQKCLSSVSEMSQ